MKRLEMAKNSTHTLSIRKRCDLLNVKRSTLYYDTIINSNSLFDYEQTFFFIKLTDIEKARMVFLMNNHYDRFVEHTYGRLTLNKKDLYKSLSDSLRSKLVEKRNAASAFSSFSSKLNLIIPFITGVLGGITTLYSAGDSEQKALLITSGTFSLLVPICSLAYGMHQWYYAIQTPTYIEKQVKLIGLYYALESRNETDTGDSIAQGIVDQLDKNYDHKRTLSQNALIKEREER